GDRGRRSPLLQHDAIGDPCGILRSTYRLSKPVADATLVARLCFLDIGEQQECTFARLQSDGRFSSRTRFSEFTGVECSSGDGQFGLDIVRAEFAQTTGSVQTVEGGVAMAQMNVDIRHVRMRRPLPDRFQNL